MTDKLLDIKRRYADKVLEYNNAREATRRAILELEKVQQEMFDIHKEVDAELDKKFPSERWRYEHIDYHPFNVVFPEFKIHRTKKGGKVWSCGV